MLDLWNSSAFDLVTMTNAFLRIERSADDITNHLPFPETPIYTNDFAFDITTTGQVKLVAASDLGSQGDIMEDDEHSVSTKFSLPFFVRRASIMNFEVEGARQPGTMRQRILEAERDKKYQKLRTQFIETKNAMRWSALSGKVVDHKGKVLLDCIKQFSLKRTSMKLKLDDSDNGINEQLIDAKVKIERILGFKPRGYKLMVTETGHAKLRRNKQYKALLTDPLAVRLAQVESRDVKVVFAGNVEVVYYQSPHIDETVNYLVPIFDDWSRSHNGPSLSDEFRQAGVLPYYAQKRILEWAEGIEMKVTMRHISFTTRPDAIFEVDITEAP